VNDLLVRYPQLLPLMHELKIHTCCGGPLPLSTAAANAGVEEGVLLDRLRTAIDDLENA